MRIAVINVQCDRCGQPIDVNGNAAGIAIAKDLRAEGWVRLKNEDFCPNCVADDPKLAVKLKKDRIGNYECPTCGLTLDRFQKPIKCPVCEEVKP